MHCALFGAPRTVWARRRILYLCPNIGQHSKMRCISVFKNAKVCINGGGKLSVYIAENVIQCILGEQVFGRCKVELKQLAHFLKLRHFLAAIRTGKRSRLNTGLQYAVFIQQTARAFVSVSACFGIEINPMFVGIAQKLCKFIRFCFMASLFMIPPFN